MPQTILGVDLGSYSLKIAEIQRGFGEFKLSNFFEVPLVAKEVVNYRQASVAALAKFISENPIPYDFCVASLPANLVSFHVMELPFKNVKKIDQTLEFELETMIPFEAEEILIDYSIISTGEQSSKVWVSYIRREEFNKFLNQVQLSQVDPRYVGIDAMDLSYLTQLGVLPPEGCYAILDMGHTKANLTVLEGNQIKAVRSLSWGGHQVTRALAKELNVSYEEAENFKHTKGHLLESGRNQVQEAVYQEYEKLSQLVKQTLFAFSESGEVPIEALYLCGGSSRMGAVDSFFSRRLNINISHLDVLDDSYTALLDKEAVRHVVPASFAMALHGVAPNKGAKINFRRGEYAYKRDIEQLGGSLKKIGVMAAAIIGIGIGYFTISYLTLSSQVDKMNKDVSKLVMSSVSDMPKTGVTSAKSALSILDGKISALNEKLKKIEGESSLSALTVLRMISAALPPRDQLAVDIDDVNIAPQRVRLEGRTGSYEAVDKVKASMEKIKEFKNVQTGNVRKGVQDEIKFSLSFDVITGEES